MHLPSHFSLSYQKADTSSTREKKLTRKREETRKVLEEKAGWVGEYEKQRTAQQGRWKVALVMAYDCTAMRETGKVSVEADVMAAVIRHVE